MTFPGRVCFVHRLLAIVLVLFFALGPLPVTTALAVGEGRSGIRGFLFESDASTKLPAARTIAINVTTGERFESNLTGSNGSYEIKGMPAGTYDIVIESSGRLFVVSSLVDIARGQRITTSFSVEPRKPAKKRIAGMADPDGTAEFVGLPPGASAAAGGGGSVLKTPLGIVSLIVITIGAAIVIDNLLDDDPPTSPIVP